MINGHTSVNSEQRYAKGRRCPICGGSDKDARGRGKRCHGFVSNDGAYAHCSREEHAGAITRTTDGNTWAHRLTGSCKCGTTHGTTSDWTDIECAYDYRDESGRLLYQVVRKIPKTFLQRKPNGDGTWDWKTGGIRRVLYRLPELLAAPRAETVYILEGEKDVDALRSLGLVATCNAMGAGKWSSVAEHAALVLRGRHVAVIADADVPGREHAKQVTAALRGHVSTLRSLELPKKDVSDWLDAGGTVEAFKQIVEHAECEEFAISQSESVSFDSDIAAALVDVRNALSTMRTVKREPLFCDATALLRKTLARAIWRVQGLITSGGVTVIGAEPKTTKTWLGFEFAIAVATGTKACGEFQAMPGVAAYFFAEDMEQQVRNRLRALLAGADRKLEAKRLHVCPRGMFLDITKDEDLAWIVASGRQLGKIDVLVLDPLRDLHSGDEDKSGPMSDVMRRLRLLGELLGCTVIVVHHAAKQSDATNGRRAGQKMRGSGAIHGSTDSGIYLSEAKGSNGSTVFRNHVVSEVKGARSAGAFDLELAVTDDANGEAEHAEFRVTRTDKLEKPATAREKDDAKMLAWIAKLARDGVRLTRRKLRDHEDLPMSDGRARDALERLQDAGRIELDDDRGGIVVLSQTSDGKTINDFIGVRGISRGESRSGMVGRNPKGLPQSHPEPEGDE